MHRSFPRGQRSPRRQGTVAALAALLLVALVGGCASTTDEKDDSVASGPATIDYEYQGYSATLPADPQRVVVLDSRAGLEIALLADYPIVATAYDEDSPLSPLVDKSASHLKNTAFELNREEIASYNPDLIVVGSGWLRVYENNELELDSIAPILAVKEKNAAADDKQFAAMTDQLTLLGRADQAEEVIKEYETSVATAKNELGSRMTGKTVTVIHVTNDMFTVLTEEDTYQAVLPALDMTILNNDVISSAPRSDGDINRRLSYENAVSALQDADIILVYKSQDGMELNPLLQRVPAMAAGHWIDSNLAERVGFALTQTSMVHSISDGITNFPAP